jgi:glycosyltransferase involved in cell wall biosynthesis
MLVSIIIPNYDYAEYLAAAIDSALGLDWPTVEVIVVDDGSRDHSRTVIESYGDRITAIFQPNGGQTAACNAAFAEAQGEVVIFLDSDDWLEPSLIRELAAVWRPGLSKVQFQMKIVDAHGRATGSVLPQYDIVPTPRQITAWATNTASYPTPPGSGNAYARAFLDRLFPLDVRERACDSHCLAAAPFLGDVVTVAKPLVAYRVHGRNDGAMTRMDSGRFATEVTRARWRFEYAQRIARSANLHLHDGVFRRSMSMLPYRLASLRLDPARHPLRGDTAAKVMRDVVRAFFVPQGLARRARLALLVWSGLVAMSPRFASERLILWRFASSSRPRALRKLLRLLALVSSSGGAPQGRKRPHVATMRDVHPRGS